MTTLEAAHPVRIGAAFWIQRTDWPSLRQAILTAERGGADTLWVDDHLLSDEGDEDDAKLEGWTTLSAAAALTTKTRIGLLVAANTFRNPGLTAKLATTVDHISGGRSILGLGAGWFEREHEAFGLDFGSGFGERLDRLEEAVGIVRRLLAGERVDHDGPVYRLRDAICAPLPIQNPLPILIGGSGPNKTLRTVARHAQLWNAYGTPETLAASLTTLHERCAEVGRDPSEIEPTFTMNVVVRPTKAEAEAVWQTYMDIHRPTAWESRVTLGTPADVARSLVAYAEVGFRHPIFVFRSPWDLETIEQLGAIRDELIGLTSV
jgi:alkanesulfonate monooxygenase SsuD/methylene tetrahydromethanopterin reductase-like flavin-dependent oxidoreductase (luciferase family)